MLNRNLIRRLFQNLSLKSKLNLVKMCRETWHSLYITNLYNISWKIKSQLTNHIIKMHVFKNVDSLCTNYFSNVTDLSFMKCLKKLNLSNQNCISNNGISGLDLYSLNLENNPVITDVTFMKNLKKLNIAGTSGVSQNSIDCLDLVVLVAKNNKKIKITSGLKSLQKLKLVCLVEKN